VTLRFRPEVAAELQDAWAWYEARQPGLGDPLLVEFESVLMRIDGSPRSFAKVHGDVHRGLLRRFPYSVFFVVEPDAMVILAVLHQAMDPVRWPRG
jgi:plasmid stabilization system protein ParE